MKTLFGTVVVALSLALTGCSAGDDPAPGDTPAPSAPAPASAEPSSSSGPTAEAGPDGAAVDCLDGAYRVRKFRAIGADETPATGTGGDLTMTFDEGSFAMASDGKDPAAITIGGENGELVLDGKLTGTYAPADSDRVTFTLGKGSGTAKLRDPQGDERTIAVQQVAEVLAPEGVATVSCEGDELTLDNKQLTLNLVR